MSTPLVPTMIPITSKYRGPSSSSDYNSNITSAYNDIVTAFAAVQNMRIEAVLQSEIMWMQYTSIGTEITALSQQVVSLQNSINSLLTAQQSTSVGIGSAGSVSMSVSLYGTPISYGGFPSYFPASAPMLPQSRAVYSPVYGQITPSLITPSISKTFIVDNITQSVVTPPGVASLSQPTIFPTVAPYSIVSTDVGNAVDSNDLTYWRENIYFLTTTSISSIQQQVTITIPEQYVNNDNCNYVIIHPYPEFGVNITSVTIVGGGSVLGATQQILPTDSMGNPIPILNAGKTRLIFPTQSVSQVVITFTQNTPNYILTPGLQGYPIGASTIDVGFANFSQNPSLVLIPFTLSNNFFNYIVGVGPSQAGISFSLYYLDPASDLVQFSIGQVLPGYVQTVYVQVTLSPTQGISPVLEELQLQFFPLYGVN